MNGWQCPVFLRGATVARVKVEPGDFILADEDGALVIPGAVVEEVLERSEALTRKEVEIRKSLDSGMSLAEALARYGHV